LHCSLYFETKRIATHGRQHTHTHARVRTESICVCHDDKYAYAQAHARRATRCTINRMRSEGYANQGIPHATQLSGDLAHAHAHASTHTHTPTHTTSICDTPTRTCPRMHKHIHKHTLHTHSAHCTLHDGRTCAHTHMRMEHRRNSSGKPRRTPLHSLMQTVGPTTPRLYLSDPLRMPCATTGALDHEVRRKDFQALQR